MAKKANTEQAPLFAGLNLNEVHPVETVSEEQAEKYQFDIVDFSDPNRPKTCLEVDFPILKVNEISAIEQNATKPIYMMSKWWARRRASVFRQLLISAATKSPTNDSKAAQTSWSLMYGKNHQKHSKFSNLKVADIFMGGGTTIVEATRLGFNVTGIDLNPVAWWVVRNETHFVEPEVIRKFYAHIESKVKSQIFPFFIANSPRKLGGNWADVRTNSKVEIDPSDLALNERQFYKWDGPEIICTFWMKHAMCTDPSCFHLTPIVGTSVVAQKTASIKYLDNCVCPHCGDVFDLEYGDFRIAPDSEFKLSKGENPFASLSPVENSTSCPSCKKKLNAEWISKIEDKKGKSKTKKVTHFLVLDRSWLKGITAKSKDQYGGYPGATDEKNKKWYLDRSNGLKFTEIRGIPDKSFEVSNLGKKSGTFNCGKCGRLEEVLNSTKLQDHVASYFPYMIQGFDPKAKELKFPYGGRFFDLPNFNQLIKAEKEFSSRADLLSLVPSDPLWFGHKTHQRDNLPAHGYKLWSDMFNKRQLYVNTALLDAVMNSSEFNQDEKSQMLGAWQNYLRHNCMFTIWNPQRDTLEPHFSNNNFQQKNTTVENGVFSDIGRGNFKSCVGNVIEGMEFIQEAYDLKVNPEEGGKSLKIPSNDKIQKPAKLLCQSSTDLKKVIDDSSIDLIITDPPFGDNVQYAELSDFFLVWLNKHLNTLFPGLIESAQAPKTLEAVSNKARQPGTSSSGLKKADEMYDRLLTMCWKEAYRILKHNGIMAFTFHHDKDEAWINVLESLFKSGFIVESVFPIRSDAAKGDGDFGAKKIEFDIVHVCKKRLVEPKEIFWATLRKSIVESVKAHSLLLAQHRASGLHLADLEVIIRGEVLEQYSRYYGKIKKNLAGESMTVKEILLEANNIAQNLLQTSELERFPDSSAPETKVLFSLFRNETSIELNSAKKRLKGSGLSIEELSELNWIKVNKVKSEKIVSLENIAERWNSLSRKKTFTKDLDQVHFAINCCIGGKQLNGKPADLEGWVEENYKQLYPSLLPILKYMENSLFGADYKQAIGMAYRTIERTLNNIKKTDGEYQKASDQLSLFE